MTNKPLTPPQRQIRIEIPPELEPVYANLARISHSPAEIIIDFACILPGEPKATVRTRMLMSPIGAKMFYRALGENLARFEASFGEINLPGDSALVNSLFRNINPPDAPEENE